MEIETASKRLGPTINRHNSEQEVSTPWPFITACDNRFGKITFDLAASKSNAKASRFYSKEDDSLKQDWYALNGLLWLNPEYNDITTWARKCAAEMRMGARILMLTPASISTNWFAEHVYGNAYVISLTGRLRFEGHNQDYPKDMMLSYYNAGITGFEAWNWKSI